MKMKQVLSLLLCLVTIVSLGATAFAEDAGALSAAEEPLEDISFFPPAESAAAEAANVTTYDVTGIQKVVTAGTNITSYYGFPIANASGTTISGQTVTKCTSSDTSIATASIKNGECWVTPKKAGFFNLTASNSTYATIWHVVVQFKDVTSPNDAFYYPVYWALNYGITTGKTNTTFEPYTNCTRAQIVTFLYRTVGSPNVPASWSNPFSDVKTSDYFYKPVLWAYYNGITTGRTATKFDPNASCTRGQAVTFLWRAAGSPSATASSSFSDVKGDEFFAPAVAWAVSQGITVGTTSTTFSPYRTCTRGQIVTFLYRW